MAAGTVLIHSSPPQIGFLQAVRPRSPGSAGRDDIKGSTTGGLLSSRYVFGNGAKTDEYSQSTSARRPVEDDAGEKTGFLQTQAVKRQERRPAQPKPIPKSAEYILDSDDSDEPFAEVMLKLNKTKSVNRRPRTHEDGVMNGQSKAIARRRSWTPVEEAADETSTSGFANLCKTFNFGDAVLSTAPSRQAAKRPREETKTKATPQRKAPKTTASASVPRTRKPAKKAMTITALATAAYQPAKPVELTSVASAITAPTEQTPAAMPPPKAKPARKPAVRNAAGAAKARKSRVAKPAVEEPVYEPLLPPTQAQRRMSEQAFVFGTSSQLQMDEPAEVLREIQQVMQVSEALPSSPILLSSPHAVSNLAVPNAPHGTSMSAAQRNMWRASARSTANGMYKDSAQDSKQSIVDSVLDVEDDVEPELPGEADEPINLSSDPAPQEKVKESIEITYSPPPAPSQKSYSQPTYMQPHRHRAALQPLNANVRLRSLSPPVAKKHRRTLTTDQSEALPPVPKRRGRPPKAVPLPIVANPTPKSSPPSKWYSVDEIMDSDAASPSPARRKASPPTAQLELATEAGPLGESEVLPCITTNVDDPAWDAVLAPVFEEMTRTIKSLPRTNSLTNPNWHEKMLLYDPIVIEDLTTWINDQGVRVTLRNKLPAKKSKRSDTEQLQAPAETVEHELTHWMVQKWCREKSICCLWKEGLRGGVRTRY